MVNLSGKLKVSYRFPDISLLYLLERKIQPSNVERLKSSMCPDVGFFTFHKINRAIKCGKLKW